jgi:hypothetical protein
MIIGAVALAPGAAEAQECVQRHFDWASAPPPGKLRTVKVEVADMSDWKHIGTVYAELTLTYSPPFSSPRFYVPARLSGDGNSVGNEHSYCLENSGVVCTRWQLFDAWYQNAMKASFTDFLGNVTFSYTDVPWHSTTTLSNGVCINNNTIAYAMTYNTFIISLEDVEVDNTPPR